MNNCAQPSNAMIKTYWRYQLHSILREQKLLREVLIQGNALIFSTEGWNEYWKDVPENFRDLLSKLKITWCEYISHGFNPTYADNYCTAYFKLLTSAINNATLTSPRKASFLGHVLGFENAVLARYDSHRPFAAITSSLRNPVFLSFQCRGLRNTDRNDPCLLPLVTALHHDKPWLFYHYRKQRLLLNTDDNLLFFPSVQMDARKESFLGFDELIEILVEPWDSRVDQRAKLIVDKVIASMFHRVLVSNTDVVRILDIGSGNGHFTSRIISRMKKIGLLDKRKIDISLLDILSTEPEGIFDTFSTIDTLSSVEYISCDYIEWLNNIDYIQNYDIVFLFRILHNVSSFQIISEPIDEAKEKIHRGRYTIYRHLSEYYRAISLLFNEVSHDLTQDNVDSHVYYPSRKFRDSSLVFEDGTSLLDKLCSISTGVLIEDGDLTPDVLLNHLLRYSRDVIHVYDFSSILGLTVNHVYWVTRNEYDGEIPGGKLWPKSGK